MEHQFLEAISTNPKEIVNYLALIDYLQEKDDIIGNSLSKLVYGDPVEKDSIIDNHNDICMVVRKLMPIDKLNDHPGIWRDRWYIASLGYTEYSYQVTFFDQIGWFNCTVNWNRISGDLFAKTYLVANLTDLNQTHLYKNKLLLNSAIIDKIDTNDVGKNYANLISGILWIRKHILGTL